MAARPKVDSDQRPRHLVIINANRLLTIRSEAVSNLHEFRTRKMIRIPSLLSFAFFGLALLAPGAAAAKFECPSPLKPSAPATLAKITSQLPDRTAMADVGRLTTTIDVLRREGLPKSGIIDDIIGAYCPMVAQEGSLSDTEKTVNVRRFSGQITHLVYSLESGLDIIINVPFTPDVVDAINAKARKQGLSGPAWIAMTVENALQLPR
jgi:hypothetical protein